MPTLRPRVRKERSISLPPDLDDVIIGSDLGDLQAIAAALGQHLDTDHP